MQKRYFGLLIASILIAHKLLYCDALYESPVRKKNLRYTRLKEQILSLAKESITESILQISKELHKNLEDIRVEMRRRDVELYQEIYNIKATLEGNETALENQTTSRGDKERHWLPKLAYVEAGMKKTAKESKNSADTLQEKVEMLESQNGMMLSRLAATEMTLMKVTSQSSISMNDSEVFISTHYLQKLNHVDERLNDMNETIQDVCNTTVDIRKAMDSFQSGVMTLKDSVDALNIYANSTLDIDTRAMHDVANLTKYIQLNLTKVISDNELYFSRNLNQTATELQATIEELRHSQNETKSNMSEIRMHQRSTNTSISDLLSSSLSLQQSVKECIRNMNNFESKYTTNDREIKDIQQQLSMFQFRMSHFQTTLNESVINNENFTFIIKEILQEFAELEKSVKILKSNLSDILQKEGRISNEIKSLDSKWSSFQLQCTAKVDSMNDSVSSNREKLEDLLNLAVAINASFEFKVKDLELTLNQLADWFSFINNSIINLELDFNSSKIMQERSYRQLNNITTTVDDHQRTIQRIVNQQAVSRKQNLISFLMKNVTDHEERLTILSEELVSSKNSIISIQSDITALINVNRDQNRSISRTNPEGTQQPPEQLLVRLVGGSSASDGRVEVFHSNAWGTICDDNWESSDARVVCKMLGYTRTYAAYEQARYGQGVGQIWMDEVGCSGSESSIFSCRHNGWGNHDCSHGEDASVKCS